MARIAVIGGTGQLGRAIAGRLVRAGHRVWIGSRDAERAVAVATEIGGAGGGSYSEAAAGRDMLIITVPFAAQAATLHAITPHIGSAIVIDTTVPLVPPKVMRVQLPPAGSAAQEAARHVPEGTRLVSAFHTIAAHGLAGDADIDSDVLVFSDDATARAMVISLAGDMGLRGLSGGGLANSAAAEALTSVLIHINRTYHADGAGIRFTGLPHADDDART